MRNRVVAVVGAGSMRCAPAVMASLAVWKPDDLVEVRLFDANEERLDLVDRLLREAMERADTGHTVKASSDLAETLDGATDVVLCLHEDCVRRMQGQSQPLLYAPENPAELPFQVTGDPNKPTQPELLSDMTQTILAVPAGSAEPINALLERVGREVAEGLGSEVRVLDLTSGETPVAPNVWPDPVPNDELQLVPHRILRWLHGEATLYDLLREAADTPLTRWLDGESDTTRAP